MGVRLLLQTFLWLCNPFPRQLCKENELKVNFNFVWSFAVEGKDIWRSTVLWPMKHGLHFTSTEIMHTLYNQMLHFLECKKYDKYKYT